MRTLSAGWCRYSFTTKTKQSRRFLPVQPRHLTGATLRQVGAGSRQAGLASPLIGRAARRSAKGSVVPLASTAVPLCWYSPTGRAEAALPFWLAEKFTLGPTPYVI